MAKVPQLTSDIVSQARAGAVDWTIDSVECFAQHGFVWAATVTCGILTLYVDERLGKVHKFEVKL